VILSPMCNVSIVLLYKSEVGASVKKDETLKVFEKS